MSGYRTVAADLRHLIENGTYQPGTQLPTIPELMERYGLSRQTIRTAISTLAAEGLVTPHRRHGTIVRDRSPVRIPLSRYQGALAPGDKGPFERATAGSGGRMELKGVTREPAEPCIADQLAIPAGTEVVCRTRHAVIGDDVVQIQRAWYPADLADQFGLDTTEKIQGGVYARLTAVGTPPRAADETIRARMPAAEEASLLGTGTGVPVLVVERVTRDGDGRVLEVVQVIAPADRVELVYDHLPLTP
jgi:GntR family transcriptional regulator